MFKSVMPHLYVADVERAAAFYRDRLGGVPTFRFPAEGALRHMELRIGDVVMAVTHRDAVLELGLPEPTAGHPMQMTVWCDSVDEAVAALRAEGVPVLLEPRDHVAGNRHAYVTDPDGNWISLVSKREGA